MWTCRRSMLRALVATTTTLFLLPAPAQAPTVRPAKSFEDFYANENGTALVTCEAIRSHGVVGGGELLFSCGVFGAGLSGVFWRVEPEQCCSRTERYRVTELEQGRENADVQLLLRADKPVRGQVRAVVVDASGQWELLQAVMDFEVAPRKNDTPEECHCRRNDTTCGAVDGGCVCTGQRPHYDPVHGVCFSAVPLGGACLYHHQCQRNDTTLECLKGRCDCGYATQPDDGRCLQVARYGERCSDRTFCAVGRCGRDGRCTCDEGQRQVRGACVAPEESPSQSPRRSLLYDNARHLLQLPFVVVCLVLLAFACVAKTTSRAAGWFLLQQPNSSSERRAAVHELTSPREQQKQQQRLTPYPGRLGDKLGLQWRKASVPAAL